MAVGIVERVRTADPVLRILATSTLFSTLGRGVFLSMSVLYLGFVVQLPPAQIALVFAASSISSIVFALIGGHLSDRISARRMIVVSLFVDGAALAAYALVHDLSLALIVGCIQSAASAIQHSA